MRVQVQMQVQETLLPAEMFHVMEWASNRPGCACRGHGLWEARKRVTGGRRGRANLLFINPFPAGTVQPLRVRGVSPRGAHHDRRARSTARGSKRAHLMRTAGRGRRARGGVWCVGARQGGGGLLARVCTPLAGPAPAGSSTCPSSPGSGRGAHERGAARRGGGAGGGARPAPARGQCGRCGAGVRAGAARRHKRGTGLGGVSCHRASSVARLAAPRRTARA